MLQFLIALLSSFFKEAMTVIINTPKETFEVKEVTHGLKVVPTDSSLLITKYGVSKDKHEDSLL